jgi:hypothetical protein
MSGLLGTPGKQVRSSRPASIADKLQIAIDVEQTEMQEERNEIFYFNMRLLKIYLKTNRSRNIFVGTVYARKLNAVYALGPGTRCLEGSTHATKEEERFIL